MNSETLLQYLAVFGLGALLLEIFKRINAVLDRRAEKKRLDKEKSLHDSATIVVKQIDDDTTFRSDLIRRIETLEHKIEKMQTEQIELIRTNAQLEGENKNLLENKDRQEKEIERLRDTNKKQEVKIVNLENDLRRTQGDVVKYVQQFEELNRKFEALGKK